MLSIAQNNPFSETKGFAVITEEDCKILGGHINGSVATGIDFIFNNTYLTVNKTSNFIAPGENERKVGLWVGGTISAASTGELTLGQNAVVRLVNRGLWNCNTVGNQTRISYNGGFNSYPRIVLNSLPVDCGSITNTGFFSVSKIFSSLKAFGKCAENGLANITFNGTEINLSPVNTLHYGELSRQQIEAGQQWTVRGVEQNKPLVIRVNGNGMPLTLNNNFFLNTDGGKYIVIYFYNLPELRINNLGGDLNASILAPATTVIKNNSQSIKGQILAKSYTQYSGSVDAVAFSASLPLTASAGNLVWKDANSNGIQDPGERGVPNISVALYDPVDGIAGNQDDEILASSVTDYYGNYVFEDITVAPCGSKFYLSFFALPAANTFTRAITGGADAANNSKVISFDRGAGITDIFLLKPGDKRGNLDAGIIGPDISTLPLHTLTVSAKLSGNNVTIDWVAENEMNTKKFIVQRSVDGILFADINEKSASGLPNAHTRYSYIDDMSALATADEIYYRIMALDDVNRYAYSNIVPVKLFSEKRIRVWPNPFADNISVHFHSTSNSRISISIFDITGKEKYNTIIAVAEGINQFQITDLEGIASGTFVMRITDLNTGSVQIQKLVK